MLLWFSLLNVFQPVLLIMYWEDTAKTPPAIISNAFESLYFQTFTIAF